MIDQLFEDYYHAISTIDKERTSKLVEDALKQGVTAEEIVFKVVVPGIEKMVEGFLQKKEIALSRHFLGTTIANEVLDRLFPLFTVPLGQSGRIVLGCAYGDFHGLGKKIVAGCLRAHMFDAVDLGLNVPAERFIFEALEKNAQVIGVSSMMVHTALGDEGPSKVRKLLRERNLEDKIKLIVGGAPYLFEPNLYKDVGADAWASNGLVAVKEIENLVKQVKKQVKKQAKKEIKEDIKEDIKKEIKGEQS